MSPQRELTQAEFEKLRSQFVGVVKACSDKLLQSAHLLARMSRYHLSLVKKDCKGILSADHIDRLALYGQNKIPLHFAQKVTTLRASLLRRLPAETKKLVSNPDSEISLWSEKGVYSKRVKNLTKYDWGRVLDRNCNIQSPTAQQRKRAIVKTRIEPGDIEDPESMIVQGNFVLFKGKVSTIRVKIKDLRKLIA